MKKLMIAAAIVCAAALSQAATCYWNVQSSDGKYIYTDTAGSITYSGTAYMFFLEKGVDQQDVLDSYKSIATLGGQALTATDGAIALTKFDNELNNTAAQYFVAIVNGDKVFLSKSYDVAGTTIVTGSDVALNLTAQSKKQWTGDFVDGQGGWYAAAVPEPTSGLLLLLGVAGLALKRKRA